MTQAAKDLLKAVEEKSGALTETSEMSQDELDQKSNRELKRNYAYWFIGILIAQLVVMNGVFVFHGLGLLQFAEFTLQIYITSTLLEVFGVIVLIVHNLFPKR